MNQPPQTEKQTGKRIVSKGEYLRVFSTNVALGVGSILAVLLAMLCIIGAWWLGYTYQMSGAVLILSTFTYFLFRLAGKGVQRLVKAETVVPLTRANAADFRAPDTLVRASSEPVQEPQTVLLRAATESVERHEEQLVRAAAGDQCPL